VRGSTSGLPECGGRAGLVVYVESISEAWLNLKRTDGQMKVLVTGGLGFIGSNLIRLILRERPDWKVVNLDLITYAGNAENLADVEECSSYQLVRGDVADRTTLATLFLEHGFDGVVHCAAETHVDRSIEDGGRFIKTNVDGTLGLLEAARIAGRVRHIQIGTDEVYGSLEANDPPFTEESPLTPRSLYSASKAAADHLAMSFYHTNRLDVVVTRCSNNYGPYQHPEKMIPLMITSAIRGLPLPVYGDGRQRRDWIHVEDHCRGILSALERGRAGEVYNFGGGTSCENIELVRRVIRLVGAHEGLISFVTDRPGHDRRYEVNWSKAKRELGWEPARSFDKGLADTVAWYREHEGWWRRAAERAYDESRTRIQTWASGSASKPRARAS